MAEYVMEYDGWAEGIPIGEYLKVRSAMHARKREQVVRCRDCKWCMSYWKADYCDYFSHAINDPEGFCAWGQAKGGGRMNATEALERRIDELCAENERLRQENQSIGMAAYELGRASLADENERLRELAQILLCGINNDMPRYEELAWTQKVNVLVRELGLDKEA